MAPGGFQITLSWAIRAPDQPISSAQARPDGLGQHDPGDRAVGAPAVADLAGEVGRVAALAPVPLVRVEPGLELAAEQGLEPGAGVLDQIRRQEPVEDQEPVLAKAGDLFRGHDQNLA